MRQEGALLQKRAEAAEAELGAQRAAHRRDLRRSARELADAQARPYTLQNNHIYESQTRACAKPDRNLC